MHRILIRNISVQSGVRFSSFRAAFLEQGADKKAPPKYTIKSIAKADLEQSPVKPKEVLVRVEYSSLNYKDSLAITGKGPIVRHWPMIPGCDWAGVVEESKSKDFKPGDRVVMNGWGGCETHWGGYSQYMSVPAQHLLTLPSEISTLDAEMLGTAGYTAMLCILKLVDFGVKPANGKVLVTGSAGGVGSFAVAFLSTMGYKVVASTGRPQEQGAYLKSIGASEVVDRKDLEGKPKPLNKTLYAGAVDTVGGTVLANVLSHMQYAGCVAATGMAGGGNLPASVMPFILRDVALLGVDSVTLPNPPRVRAWKEVARVLDRSKLALIVPNTAVIGMEEAGKVADSVVSGKHRGRYVVDVSK